MKIEAGKYYKCGNGQKAFVGYVLDDKVPYPLIGHMVGDDFPSTWTLDGRTVDSCQSHYDLVEEWVEPRSGTVWVNINEVPIPHGVHKTKTNADVCAINERLACVRVDWVEGQYDE